MSHDILMTTIQATQPGCEGGTPLPAQIQKLLMLQEEAGSRAQKLNRGPPWMSQGPWDLAECPCSAERPLPLPTLFPITAEVSCSSLRGVTPELIKCESLIVLAISHHILLICITLVSIFTNVT